MTRQPGWSGCSGGFFGGCGAGSDGGHGGDGVVGEAGLWWWWKGSDYKCGKHGCYGTDHSCNAVGLHLGVA